MASEAATILFSRAPAGEGAAERAAFEEQLLAGLGTVGAVEVVVAPHLTHVPGDHPLWAHLRQPRSGPLVVLSWLYPRPVVWLLAARRVLAGREAKACRPSTRPRRHAPAVQALRLQEFADTEAALAAVRASAPPSAGGGRVLRLDLEPVVGRWYPVIDYGRCRACGQCYEFCMFGVYAKQRGRYVVQAPDHCKTGCPACARNCPAEAIVFPDYAQDPVIAGAEPAVPAAEPALAATPSSPALQTAPAPPHQRDELDDLIDALDKLDT